MPDTDEEAPDWLQQAAQAYGFADAAPAYQPRPQSDDDGWNSDNDKLVTLANGGSVIQQDNGVAHLLPREQAYANTRNVTDNANDALLYKQYLAQTGAHAPSPMQRQAVSPEPAATEEKPDPPEWLQRAAALYGFDKPGVAHTTFNMGGGEEMEPGEQSAFDSAKTREVPQSQTKSSESDVAKAKADADRLAKIRAQMAKLQAEHDAELARLKKTAPALPPIKSGTGGTISPTQVGPARTSAATPMAYSPTTAAAGAGLGVPITREVARSAVIADYNSGKISADDYAKRIAQADALPSAEDLQRQSQPMGPPRPPAPQADPYAALRGAQVRPGYVDPLQAQIQAERAGQQAPAESEADNAARLKAASQENPDQPFDPNARDAYRSESSPSDQTAVLAPPGSVQDQGAGGAASAQQFTPQTVIPGGWQSTVSPEVNQLRSEYEASNPLAAGDTTMEGRVQAQRFADAYAQQRGLLQAQQDSLRQQQMDAQQAHARAQSDYDAAQKEASQAKVDPDKIYGPTGGGKLAAILGAALGAFGASLTHTPNSALEILKTNIESSLQAQKAEMANKQKVADNAYARLVGATGDERAADNAFRVAGLQVADAQLKELGAGAQGTALEAGLRAMIQKQLQDNINFRMATQRNAPTQVIGGQPINAGAGAEVDDKHDYIELPTDFGGYKEGERFIVPKDQFKTISAATAAFGAAKSEIERMNSVFEQHPVKAYVPETAAHNEVQSAINNVVENYSKIAGIERAPSKAMVGHFREQLESSVWNAALGASGQDRSHAAMAGIKNVYGSLLHTLAPPQGHETLTASPSGVRPGSEYTGEIARRQQLPSGWSDVQGLDLPGYKAKPVEKYNPTIRVEKPAPPAKGRKGGNGGSSGATSDVIEQHEPGEGDDSEGD